MTIQCMENRTRVTLPNGETGRVYFTRRIRKIVDNDNDTVVEVEKDNGHSVKVKYSQLTRVPDELPCEDKLSIAEEATTDIIDSIKIMLSEVGGCDADDDYHKGYDKAVDEMESWMKENIPNF